MLTIGIFRISGYVSAANYSRAEGLSLAQISLSLHINVLLL